MATKTDRLLKSMKRQSFEPKTPIATDMFLPNLSGDITKIVFMPQSLTRRQVFSDRFDLAPDGLRHLTNLSECLLDTSNQLIGL